MKNREALSIPGMNPRILFHLEEKALPLELYSSLGCGSLGHCGSFEIMCTERYKVSMGMIGEVIHSVFHS
jgi:hypothetical protein